LNSLNATYETALSIDDYLFIRKAQAWDDLEYSQGAMALKNSIFIISCKVDFKTIGFVRLIGDMATSFYIQEIAVLPEYQNQGIGKELMKRAILFVKSCLKNDWKATIRLKSMPKAKSFYENLGFVSFPNKDDKNSLMMLVIN